MTRKQLHDRLMANKPEANVHEACELCTPEEDPKGGTHTVTTYTAEDVQAAVDAAVAELQSQVDALESAAQESEIEARVAAAQEAAAAEVEELRAQLDQVVLEKQGAIDELEAFKAELEEIASAEALEAEIASRREARIAQVKEVASFPDEYVEQNADRFAAMSEEDFEARLAEYAALSTSKPAGAGIPKTALTASREIASKTTSTGLVRELMRDSLVGIDPRTL